MTVEYSSGYLLLYRIRGIVSELINERKSRKREISILAENKPYAHHKTHLHTMKVYNIRLISLTMEVLLNKAVLFFRPLMLLHVLKYRKSSIKPPRGAYFFQALLRVGGGLNREGGGGFNLAKRITCSKNTVVGIFSWHLPPVYQQLSRSRTSWTFAYRIIISAV